MNAWIALPQILSFTLFHLNVAAVLGPLAVIISPGYKWGNWGDTPALPQGLRLLWCFLPTPPFPFLFLPFWGLLWAFLPLSISVALSFLPLSPSVHLPLAQQHIETCPRGWASGTAQGTSRNYCSHNLSIQSFTHSQTLLTFLACASPWECKANVFIFNKGNVFMYHMCN